MQKDENDFTRKLLRIATFVMLGHFAVVIWHLLLLVKVQPSTPRSALLLLIVINLVPVVALFAFRKGLSKLAGGMILVPLGVAIVIGGYTHFLSTGTDNIFQMSPGELRVPFQVSAVLEAVGCWVGLRMLASAAG